MNRRISLVRTARLLDEERRQAIKTIRPLSGLLDVVDSPMPRQINENALS
jgi:hypothetical protein